jgi:hypothetical protein
VDVKKPREQRFSVETFAGGRLSSFAAPAIRRSTGSGAVTQILVAAVRRTAESYNIVNWEAAPA